jgi:hypothetical protein
MPKRSSFGSGERVDRMALKKALNEAWRAADPFGRRAVFEEILGRWIRRGQFLFGDSPVSFRPYSIALNLDSCRWRDSACECPGHGLLALAAHTMGLSRAKAAARTLFLLRPIEPRPYRPRLGARGPRSTRRRPTKPPQPPRTVGLAVDRRGAGAPSPPPPLPPPWEILVPPFPATTRLPSEGCLSECSRDSTEGAARS